MGDGRGGRDGRERRTGVVGPDPGAALAGRRVAAGERTRRLAARLLGLDAPAGPSPVRSAAWAGQALEVGVAVPGGAEVVARLERRGPGSEGMVRTRDLVLFFRGDGLPESLVRAVSDLAPARLEGWTLERLAAEVAADPELGRAGLPAPEGPVEDDRPRSLLDTWGDRDAYADFFAGGELARCQLDSLDPSGLFSFVQHSDSECVHVGPHAVAPLVSLVAFPWEGRARREGAERPARRLADAATEELVTTELDERDVILGNPGKLDRALAHAVARQRRHGKTVFFSNTCVPAVTGEDVASRVGAARAASGCPLLYLTVTPSSMVEVFRGILVDRRLAAERSAPPPEPRAVNLVGFARGRDLDELRELLSGLGVTVAGALLPDLDLDLVDALPRAALSVYRPNRLWQHLYDQLRVSTRTAAVSPAAPFGLEATRRWLREVARAVGAEQGFERRWQEAVLPWQEAWDTARRRAEGERLCLVVRSRETYFLTRPDATWGIPLVAALDEMGFGLDVLVHAEDRASARRAVAEVRAALGPRDRHAVRLFGTFDAMMRRLAESEARALLSSHTFDWRVTSAGKSPFSLQCFEMGVRGAVRTIERLLSICETPFYRRFGRHLGRTRAGLRPPPEGADRG